MRFQGKAEAEKLLWQGPSSYLYMVVDKTDPEKPRKWKMFTEEELAIGKTYSFEGTISESKDKKVKDTAGYDIYRTNFNADKIVEDSESLPF